MAAQDVATMTFTDDSVAPIEWSRAYAKAVKLKASTVYPKGCVLGPVTASPGTYAAYASGNSDGSQVAELILRRACATDSAGNVTLGGQSGGGEWGQTQTMVSAWVHGDFLLADIPASGTGAYDATALTGLKGKASLNGTVLSF